MVWRSLSVTRTGGALQSAFFVHEGVEGYINNRKNARNKRDRSDKNVLFGIRFNKHDGDLNDT